MGHEPRWDIRGQQCCRLRMMEDKNEEHNHTSPFAPPGYSFTCAFVRKQKQNGPRINPGLILLLFLLIFHPLEIHSPIWAFFPLHSSHLSTHLYELVHTHTRVLTHARVRPCTLICYLIPEVLSTYPRSPTQTPFCLVSQIFPTK